ncbi:MAG: type II toxin-antitoxin system CcdA family antitoxin [Luteimonas sp.]
MTSGARPMRRYFDPGAPKRPVNLFLNEDLVRQVRSTTSSLSAEVETLLAESLAARRQQADAQARSLRRASAAWNAFAHEHGSFADEFSSL